MLAAKAKAPKGERRQESAFLKSGSTCGIIFSTGRLRIRLSHVPVQVDSRWPGTFRARREHGRSLLDAVRNLGQPGSTPWSTR